MTQEFIVGDISCGHCAQAITKGVSAVAGVKNVNVDLGSKRVSVDANEQVSTETIIQAISQAGYDKIVVVS